MDFLVERAVLRAAVMHALQRLVLPSAKRVESLLAPSAQYVALRCVRG